MAEAHAGDKGSGAGEVDKGDPGFKLNAEAPEFVPCYQTPAPIAGVFHPWYGFLTGDSLLGADWLHFIAQEPLHVFSDAVAACSDESSPLTPSKKVKSLAGNHQKLASALRASSGLVVSQDGSKVRRRQAFTEREKEELQSRTVVVENLPEDHSRKNLEKIFRVAGSIRSLKVCRPQDLGATRSSKGDFVVSNKLHALVEYETVGQAERAVERLNDEGNWRKGLRVRIMLRRTPRSVIRGRRADCDPFDVNSEDEEPHPPSDSPAGTSQPPSPSLDHSSEDSPSAAGRRAWAARSREKLHGAAAQNQIARGLLSVSAHAGPGLAQPSTPGKQAAPRSPRPAMDCGRGILSPFPQAAPPSSSGHGESSGKNSPRTGPRMPDGTRGFSLGRGKPLVPPGGGGAA